MRAAAAWVLSVASAACLAAYLASTVLTDRVASMQLGWWIPRAPFALGCAVLLLAAALAWRRGARARRAYLAMSALAAVFAALDLDRDFGLPRARPEGGVRIVQWNTAWTSERDADTALEALLSLDADLFVLGDIGHLFRGGGLGRAEALGYTLRSRGRLSLLSRLPVGEARILHAAEGATVSRFAVETSDGPLVIDAFDLPRDPRRPRYQAAAQLALDLARQGPAPDVIVGDFNSTRGSASVELLLPGGIEAFAASGTGWGGTYPRYRPWLAIDLLLAKPPWRTVWAKVHDLGARPHRAQEVVLRKAG